MEKIQFVGSHEYSGKETGKEFVLILLKRFSRGDLERYAFVYYVINGLAYEHIYNMTSFVQNGRAI